MRIGLVADGVAALVAVGPAAAQQAATTPEATQPAAQVVRSGTWSMTLPLGLQADAAYIPDDNPLSDEKIELGKLLYFDARLSKDETLSCASVPQAVPRLRRSGGDVARRRPPARRAQQPDGDQPPVLEGAVLGRARRRISRSRRTGR